MKVDEAKDILGQLKLPTKQQNDMCARVFLALAKLPENGSWKRVSNEFSRIHDVIQFLSENYDVSYAENTRETIRKDALKPLRAAAIIEDNGKSTNSPNFAYRFTTEMIELLNTYNTPFWASELATFLDAHKELEDIYNRKRRVKQIPILINGEPATLSLGVHNKLQKAIIEEFASRFAHNSRILYIGDTQNRFLYKDNDRLADLKIKVIDESTLPDVILYRDDKQWVYFVEAVTSSGPMTKARVEEIKSLSENCPAELIFITAFNDLSTYKKFILDLAWETEVWIADLPEHMIHLNGDKFFGPREEGTNGTE